MTTAAYRLQTPDLRVMSLLLGLARQKKERAYVYPSQRWIRTQLAQFHSRTMSARTINYHLGALERQGWFKRQRRHTVGPAGMEFHSTLYVLTRRAFTWLQRMSGHKARPTWTRAAQSPENPPEPVAATVRPDTTHPPPEFAAALTRLKDSQRRR